MSEDGSGVVPSTLLKPAGTSWRRNLYVIWLAEFVAMVGFSAALPFLPYYVQELGVTAPGQVEIWSGMLYAAHAVTMGIMGPVWGSLGDRMGRKLMVTRAMFGGAMFLGAMGFVSSVRQLLVLRILQGAVTGTVGAATALVAAGTPKEQRTHALGLLQMGIFLGASFGPVLGGVVADVWGYRAPFWVTGALLAIGGVLVAVLVREVQGAASKGEVGSFQGNVRTVLRSAGILPAFGVRLLVRTAYRMADLVLPLFVQALMPAHARVSSLVGLVASVRMAASATGSVAMGRVGERVGLRRVLMISIAGCVVSYSLQSVASSFQQLLVLQALAGLSMGGILTSLTAILSRCAPDGRQGTVFGLDGSVMSVANAVGPMLGGMIAATWGVRAPFTTAALCFALAAPVLLVLRASGTDAKTRSTRGCGR